MLQEPLTGLNLQQFLAMHCEAALLTRNINVDAVTAEVAKLSSQREVAAGHTLFTFGETPESFFLILKVRWGRDVVVKCSSSCTVIGGCARTRL